MHLDSCPRSSTHTLHIHTYTYVRIRIHIYIGYLPAKLLENFIPHTPAVPRSYRDMSARMYACMHVCMCMCVYDYACHPKGMFAREHETLSCTRMGPMCTVRNFMIFMCMNIHIQRECHSPWDPSYCVGQLGPESGLALLT
jgi:hypothetical protein